MVLILLCALHIFCLIGPYSCEEFEVLGLLKRNMPPRILQNGMVKNTGE